MSFNRCHSLQVLKKRDWQNLSFILLLLFLWQATRVPLLASSVVLENTTQHKVPHRKRCAHCAALANIQIQQQPFFPPVVEIVPLGFSNNTLGLPFAAHACLVLLHLLLVLQYANSAALANILARQLPQRSTVVWWHHWENMQVQKEQTLLLFLVGTKVYNV